MWAMKTKLLISWFLLNVLAFAYFYMGMVRHEGSDYAIGLFWVLSALNFPLGPAIVVGLHLLFSISTETLFLSWVSTFIGFLIFGYLQWFVLLPKAIAFVRKRTKRSDARG